MVRERRRRTTKTTAIATVESVPEITTEANGKPAKPEDFVDMRFLKELEKEGFLKQFQKKT